MNWYYKHQQDIRVILLITLYVIMIIFFLTSCSVLKKTRTITKTEIDTIYVNHNIDTLIASSVTVINRKDSIIFDTVKVESNFSKVRVYPANGKIKVELLSKPFEIKIHATETKRNVTTEYKKITTGTLIKTAIFFFLCGCLLTAGILFYIFKGYKLSKT